MGGGMSVGGCICEVREGERGAGVRARGSVVAIMARPTYSDQHRRSLAGTANAVLRMHTALAGRCFARAP